MSKLSQKISFLVLLFAAMFIFSITATAQNLLIKGVVVMWEELLLRGQSCLCRVLQ